MLSRRQFISRSGTAGAAIGDPNPQNPDIVSEAISLAEYRAKYALYRSDKALRNLHAKFPMIDDLGLPPEGDRVADDDDAGQGHRRLVLRLRQLATPAAA